MAATTTSQILTRLLRGSGGYVPLAPDCTVCTLRIVLGFEQAIAVKLANSGAVWLGG